MSVSENNCSLTLQKLNERLVAIEQHFHQTTQHVESNWRDRRQKDFYHAFVHLYINAIRELKMELNSVVSEVRSMEIELNKYR